MGEGGRKRRTEEGREVFVDADGLDVLAGKLHGPKTKAKSSVGGGDGDGDGDGDDHRMMVMGFNG